jgi:alkanesulfonate monooxygenase SsuD/methylene tetrahydromethanopterin reductase-like flavin-dependent oxidoreductase (luciferase family)
MSDVNEELVRRFYELQGYFVRTNLPYAVPRGRSDIDLCVFNPKTADRAAVEVKGWHTESITPAYLKEHATLLSLCRPEAIAAAAELFGSDEFRKVLVVSRIGPSRREEVIRKATECGIDEIIEFKAILRLLIKETTMNENAGSEGEHVLRLLKTYRFLEGS